MNHGRQGSQPPTQQGALHSEEKIMFAYTLNQAGQKFVTEAIEKHCKENTFADAFFADAEFNADEDGSYFEIGSQYTLTGNPVVIGMNEEHFDAHEIEE